MRSFASTVAFMNGFPVPWRSSIFQDGMARIRHPPVAQSLFGELEESVHERQYPPHLPDLDLRENLCDEWGRKLQFVSAVHSSNIEENLLHR